MLDEAQLSIMMFIKGPVCRGKVALDVIRDHFWVFFKDPDLPHPSEAGEFLAEQAKHLDLPATTGSNLRPVHYWHRMRKQEQRFLAGKDAFMASHAMPQGETVDSIWDGDGTNPNAALTVYRHHDNASVSQGLLGMPPKTAWVIGYSLLERIHYLLVAGYDVYGNLGHQLDTRLYMDFLRMEGESNFLDYLPAEARKREGAFWYRGADEDVKDFLRSPAFDSQFESGVTYKTDDPKTELYELLAERLQGTLPRRHLLESIGDADVRAQLAGLEELQGGGVTLLPDNAFVQVIMGADDVWVTLIRNKAHSNITAIFGEQKNRLPQEDTLAVVPGFIGAYPNAFYTVTRENLEQFVSAIRNLRSESDYAEFLDKYGVRRTNVDFWQHSDKVNAASRASGPHFYGMLDYSRLENR